MATKHSILNRAVRQIAGAMSKTKNKVAAVMVIPLLVVSMLFTTTSIRAEEVKPLVPDNPASIDVVKAAMESQAQAGFAPVDYSKVDYSPDAPFFEGIYPVDPATFIQAECGGKYLDEECFVRVGVPIPPNVAFTAVDKDGKPTFRGVRPPTAEEMKAVAPDTFPDSELPAMMPGVRGYYGDWGHDEQGWLLGPLLTPNRGVFATNSSPNWNMPGTAFWDYFLFQTMYPGSSCIEAGMMHQMYQGVVTHGKMSFNHCANATPNYPQNWYTFETHNAAWSTQFERSIMGGMSYQEYIYVYAPEGSFTPSWHSCAQDVMYDYTAAMWVQKSQVCGWNNQITNGDGWNLVEWVGLWNWQTAHYECQNHPSVVWMSNSQYYVNPNIQWEAIGSRASIKDSISANCGSANFGNTWDGQGVRGWIFF